MSYPIVIITYKWTNKYFCKYILGNKILSLYSISICILKNFIFSVKPRLHLWLMIIIYFVLYMCKAVFLLFVIVRTCTFYCYSLFNILFIKFINIRSSIMMYSRLIFSIKSPFFTNVCVLYKIRKGTKIIDKSARFLYYRLVSRQ